jgi:hypothetical protein
MTHVYTHAPRPVSGPITFTLDGDTLTVDNGRKVQEVNLRSVETVRMTYEPRSFARKAFQTRIRLGDGKSFAFSSLSWRSLIEAESLDRDYRAFTRALFQAIRKASPKARFVGGRPRVLWTATAILAAASLVAMAVFIWRALQAGATGAVLMGALFLGLGIWQLEPMVRLNKPQDFSPDEPPRELLP